MNIVPIIQQYYSAFTARYKTIALPGHLKALDAMVSCRTKDCGELYVHLVMIYFKYLKQSGKKQLVIS